MPVVDEQPVELHEGATVMARGRMWSVRLIVEGSLPDGEPQALFITLERA